MFLSWKHCITFSLQTKPISFFSHLRYHQVPFAFLYFFQLFQPALHPIYVCISVTTPSSPLKPPPKHALSPVLSCWGVEEVHGFCSAHIHSLWWKRRAFSCCWSALPATQYDRETRKAESTPQSTLPFWCLLLTEEKGSQCIRSSPQPLSHVLFSYLLSESRFKKWAD